MTLLAVIVAASSATAETPKRTRKVAALAECLRALEPDEVAIGAAFLSGEPPQGKIGVGYAQLREARAIPAAATATLTLRDVDTAIESYSAISGKGSSAKRAALLAHLFERATTPEQDFLLRLLIGELRQGALEGVMIDAIANAASVKAEEVRRAAMFAGNVPLIASVAVREGAVGLARFELEVLRPVAPMLAQTAETVAEAYEALRDPAFEWKLDGARVQVHKAGD